MSYPGSSESDFERIKREVSLLDEVQRLTGNQPKKHGNSYDLGQCISCHHKDCCKAKKENGIWLFNCKSDECNFSGTVIDFVMKNKGYDKLEALKYLAETNGISLHRENSEEPQKPEHKHTDIFEAAAEYYHKILLKDKSALSYQLNKRCHSKESLKAFKVGFSDGRLQPWLINQGFTQEQIIESGLVAERKGKLQDYFFKGLYIYPHLTKDGKVGHFTCKDPAKKYVLQLKKEYKNQDCLFYNMPAFKSRELILVEGEDDLLTVWDKGKYKNVSAINGSLSKEQREYIKKWTASGGDKSLYLCFDNPTKKENAGSKYVKQISEDLQEYCYTPRAKEINNQLYEKAEKKAKAENESKGEKVKVNFFKIYRLFRLFRIRFNPEIKDIDDVLKAEISPEKKMKTLVEGAEPVLKPLKDVLSDYKVWKKRSGQNPFNGEIGELIFEYFNHLGKFFIDTEKSSCCLFFNKKLYEVGNGKTNIAFPSLLYREAGLIAGAKGVSEIITVIISQAYYYSKHIKYLPWIKTEGLNIYFNLSNERNEIIKLSPKNIEILQNGTNPESVLLKSPDPTEPLNYNPGIDIKESMTRLKEIVMDSLTCSVNDQYFLICTILNLILIEFTRSLGIVHLRGGTGASKSGSAEFLSVLTYGTDVHVSTTSAASNFRTASQNPLNFDDNLEDIDRFKADFLFQVATGGGKTKSKTGTDSEVVREKGSTQMFTTSIHPLIIKGKTEEIISRTNVIECSKEYFNLDSFPGEIIVKEQIKESRDQIWSAFFKIIAYEILPDFIEKRKKARKHLFEEFRGHAKERLNELYSSLFILCESLVKYIPHPVFSQNGRSNKEASKDILYEWINNQKHLSDDISSSDNDVLLRLNLLADEFRAKGPKEFKRIYSFENDPEFAGGDLGDYAFRKKPDSISFLASPTELWTAFQTLGSIRRISNVFNSPSVLGKRVSNSLEVLNNNGWEFEKTVKRTSSAHYHKYTKTF